MLALTTTGGLHKRLDVQYDDGEIFEEFRQNLQRFIGTKFRKREQSYH